MAVMPNTKRYKICQLFYQMKFGKNVRITGMPRWGSESYLINIGNDVTITQDVVFHTHDGGVHVLRKNNPGLNIFGTITIGNNVFIGSNVILMPNVHIGNNVVIGSGSIIARDIPNNCVAIGAPARPIKTLEAYLEKSLDSGIIVPNNLNRKQRETFIKSALNKKIV